jgi:glycogen debranching enzyme
VVTPRIGKPVEIQALWLAALHAAGARSDRWAPLFARGRDSFARRFWNASASCLYDVVDPDGHAGAADASFRPNQILAVGGLPLQLLGGERARAVVDGVESRLWTPLGLRSLAPGEPGVMSNLGLSYALGRDLPRAETTLREAAAHARADMRVRQNLALVLALQGKFDEAEKISQRDLSPADASANVATIRKMIAESNTWRQIQQGGKSRPATPARRG